MIPYLTLRRAAQWLCRAWPSATYGCTVGIEVTDRLRLHALHFRRSLRRIRKAKRHGLTLVLTGFAGVLGILMRRIGPSIFIDLLLAFAAHVGGPTIKTLLDASSAAHELLISPHTDR